MEITAKELQEKIDNGEKIIVEFWAPWCGPCRMMKPIFEKVATSNDTDVQMYTMDVDLNREVLTELPLKFNKVNGDFDCSFNKLTSLQVEFILISCSLFLSVYSFFNSNLAFSIFFKELAIFLKTAIKATILVAIMPSNSSRDEDIII
jgi:thiol-disulfide isomerase/thioredoxin